MTAPTEQDRAVARRTLRRIADRAHFANLRAFRACTTYECPCSGGLFPGRFDAAVAGARAGREYRAKELKRDADAAHARVEGHMLDRQIAHLTKGSK